MNTKKGIGRIARALSVVGWLILGASILTGSTPANRELFFLFLVIGTVVFAAVQAVVWVIDGFTDSLGDDRATLWPLRFRRRGSAALGVREPAQATRYDLVGVHGWLFFFVVLLMVLSPLQMITQTAKNLSTATVAVPLIVDLPGWHAYEIATWVSVAAYCAGMIWAAWGLMKYRVPASVRVTIYVVWAVPVLSAVVDAYLASTFLGADPSSILDPSVIGKTVGSLVWAAIWTVYFKLSRRVRNTYYQGLQDLEPHTRSTVERREPKF